jgi:hypothetical protein
MVGYFDYTFFSLFRLASGRHDFGHDSSHMNRAKEGLKNVIENFELITY